MFEIALRRLTAALQIFSVIFGYIGILIVGVTYGLASVVEAVGLVLLPIPLLYGLSSYMLWRDRLAGYVFSFILNILALLDIETESFSFSYSNGFFLNLEFEFIMIDIWSFFLIFSLIVLLIVKFLRIFSGKPEG